MTPLRRARIAPLATVLAAALVLSACGTDGKAKPKAEPSVTLPTGNVKVPDGVELTKAGTELAFREPAVVAYEPNAQRSSVLSLTVNSVQTGKIKDLAAFQLDDHTKKARPFYVQVSVKNIGTGDLSGMAVPLFAVDGTNSLVQPSSFTTSSFTRCPSLSLPKGYTTGKTYAGCLLYLVPNAGTLEEMSYRPLQAFEPITWKGTILPQVTKKKPDKKPTGKKTKKANP